MAETNRVSGRQGASTSGRQAPSVSGRVAAPTSSGPSGRMPAAPPGPRPASSARMAPAAPSASGRTAASSGRTSASSGRAAPPPPAPARASARKSAGGVGRARGEDGGGRKKKGPAVGGKELLIAAAVIAVLAGFVIVMAMRNSSKQKEITDSIHAKEEAERLNYEAAEKTFRLAEEKGFGILFGKEEFNEAKHFGAFKADPAIYNIIFERRYKDKKGKETTSQHALYGDKMSLMKTEYGTEKDSLRINYALADNKALNVVIAVKNMKIPEGDALTVSSVLTVIVKAPADDPKFDKARNATVPEPPKETPKEAPKEAGK